MPAPAAAGDQRPAAHRRVSQAIRARSSRHPTDGQELSAQRGVVIVLAAPEGLRVKGHHSPSLVPNGLDWKIEQIRIEEGQVDQMNPRPMTAKRWPCSASIYNR